MKEDIQNYSLTVMFRGTPCSIKLIEKLTRRRLINSSDVFVIKGFTVGNISIASAILVGLIISNEIITSVIV